MRHQDSIRFCIEQLKQYGSLSSLRESDFFKRENSSIRRYLNTPDLFPYPGTSAHLKQFLRVVSWNIEKGIQWKGIAEILRVDPYLRTADLILLNEVDHGMARSGNVHIARELAHSLKMNCVFAPAYLEMTKGIGKDLEAPGENRLGVQGNAILSRYPLDDVRITELPGCYDCLTSEEKRYGRRIALQATVFTDLGAFLAVCTHLEVLDTPACRRRQMRAILDSLKCNDQEMAVLVGGDWNTHTFSRGTRWRTLRAYTRVGLTNPDRLMEQLRHPDRGNESLFRDLNRQGFNWRDFNDFLDTCGFEIPHLPKLGIPRLFHGAARRRMKQLKHRLRFRLDWLAARGLKSLRENEVRDAQSGVLSSGPLTHTQINEGQPLSDHHPISADIRLPPEQAIRAGNRAA